MMLWLFKEGSWETGRGGMTRMGGFEMMMVDFGMEEVAKRPERFTVSSESLDEQECVIAWKNFGRGS